MRKKKVFKKKNELRRRTYHIIMSDRNNDEIKRTNQKIDELNSSYNNLFNAFKKCNEAFDNAIKIINNNIFRSHPDTIL